MLVAVAVAWFAPEKAEPSVLGVAVASINKELDNIKIPLAEKFSKQGDRQQHEDLMAKYKEKLAEAYDVVMS